MSHNSVFTGLHLNAANICGTMLFYYTILLSILDALWGQIEEKNFTTSGILQFYMVLH